MHATATRLLTVVLITAGLRAAPTVTTSASLRVFEDTNVFLQDDAPLTAGQATRTAAANEAATGLDALASLTFAWKPAVGAAIEVGYSPEFVRYVDHASEDHTDHALTAAFAASAGLWSADLKARYLIVDGSDEAPAFNALGGTPAIGGEPVRARRAQAISRASGKVTRKLPAGFVRGVLAVYDQEFHTRERSGFGYCNYTDRGESTVGLETGCRLVQGWTLVTGVRVGQQRQANVLGAPLNFSNSLTRWVVGVEGTPTKTLKLSLIAGPDVRHYGESVRPGFQRSQRTGYGEASATWTPSKQDSVGLTAKRYLWFSSGGRSLYADAVIDLTWRRVLAATWTGSTGFNWHDGDSSHFSAWSPRHDRIYTGTIGLSHALAKKTRVDFDLLHDRGVSLVANVPGREYARWIGSITVARSW